MKEKRPKLVLTSRDRKILTFLWRWKFASTLLVHARYFCGSSRNAAYNRLKKLEAHGYITQRQVHTSGDFAWKISKKGFYYVKQELPELKSQSINSEAPWHDALTSVIHLGEWLDGAPHGSAFFSEQQLRTYLPEHHPSWLPDISFHRPDGFWYIGHVASPLVIALEVQRTAQSKRWWRKVASFYNSSHEIHSVVWVCENKNEINGIFKNISASAHYKGPKHYGYLLRDVKMLGWDAVSLLWADEQMSIRKLLMEKPCESPVKSHTPLLFDFRKNPVIPIHYITSKEALISV